MFKNKTGSGIKSSTLLIIGVLVMIPFAIYIGYQMSKSQIRLIPLSIIPLILGAIIENKRLTGSWTKVLLTTGLAFIFSFSIFIQGKHEKIYILEDHIQLWPYWFLLVFILITIFSYKDKIIPRISESFTLIMSVAILYWIIAHGFHQSSYLFIKVILTAAFLIALFSILNAFVNIKLSRSLRLFLSIWSSIIMAVLAIDNIFTVYSAGPIESYTDLSDQIMVGAQYFLLGVSSIYIIQNLIMIFGFLPGRNEFFNKKYFENLEKVKADHINRYSDRQSSFYLSLICLLGSGIFLMLNYHFNFLHRNTAIWIVFFVFSRVIFIFSYNNVNPPAEQKQEDPDRL